MTDEEPPGPCYVVRRGVGITRGADLLVCSRFERGALRFEADSAEFASVALDLLATPKSEEELRAALSERARADVPATLVAELLGAFKASGVVDVREERDPTRAPDETLRGVRVVLALSGAVASAGAPMTVLGLQRKGATVRVALSRVAKRFVSPMTLRAMTHRRAPSSLFTKDPRWPAPHVEMAGWADAIFVAPASATTIARIAAGDCSDLVSATVVASAAPVLVAPSMNERMLASASVRRNLATLLSDGHFVLEPARGVEVAETPGRRRAKAGAILESGPLVEAFAAWFRLVGGSLRPRRATDWNEVYRSDAPDDWTVEGIDADLSPILARHAPPPARMLDVGCGLGGQAHAAAEMGYTVVGIDGSSVAIEAAVRAHPQSRALFLEDDVLEPRLKGVFDLVLDRGTFHVLPADRRARYAASVARWTREGSIVCIVHDGPGASARYATHKLDHEEVEAVFASGFAPVERARATLRAAEPDEARVTVLRRRSVLE